MPLVLCRSGGQVGLGPHSASKSKIGVAEDMIHDSLVIYVIRESRATVKRNR